MIGARKEALDTPALLLDLDVMEGNIARIADACRGSGVAWRPHMKGLKVPALAHKALQAGALGVTCAKLGEAEVMAAAGIRDILIANQIVAPSKIARLAGLRRHADIAVLVDDADNVAALATAARAAGVVLRVLIEVDIGMGRAGLQPGNAVLALAEIIARSDGARLAGVAGWEAHTTQILDQDEKARAIVQAVGLLTGTAAMLRAAGHPVDIVSCGGTGTYPTTVHQKGVTEIQAGGGILSDVRYRTMYHIDHPYALTIMTTVISRPSAHRIICDAGKKAMSADSGEPQPIGIEGSYSLRFSAEHLTLDVETANNLLRVGDTLEFVVGYSDTTVHLHEEMIGTRGGHVEIIWPILGRGKIK
jgi:D-serine deaminase-like pyridoxal phosphate-dependent protein